MTVFAGINCRGSNLRRVGGETDSRDARPELSCDVPIVTCSAIVGGGELVVVMPAVCVHVVPTVASTGEAITYYWLCGRVYPWGPRLASGGPNQLGGPVVRRLRHLFVAQGAVISLLRIVMSGHQAVTMAPPAVRLREILILGVVDTRLLRHIVHKRCWPRVRLKDPDVVSLHFIVIQAM
jgi:hypothetical protein